MEKLSDIISKQVVSLKEACKVGYVLNVVFDEEYKYISGYILSDEESEVEKYLEQKDVLKISNEGIFVNSAFDMQNLTLQSDNNPLGKMVYDKEGNNLGRVEECFLNKNMLVKLQTSSCEILQKNIFSIGKDFVIFDKNKKSKSEKKNKFLQTSGQKINQKVEILNKIVGKEKINFSSTLPIKITANKNKLLGKILTSDVFGFNNELIGKKNDKITEKIIKTAINHNKLNYLFFLSK